MTLFGTDDNMRKVLEKSMEQWELLLTSNGENGYYEEVDISSKKSFTTVTA